MNLATKSWEGKTDKVISDLETSKDGLSEQEVKNRVLKFGKNVIAKNVAIPYFKIFLEQFFSILSLLMIIAAVISFLLGDLRNGIVISIIVLLNAAIGFFQEFKAEKVIIALNRLLPEMVKVKRDGREIEKPIESLVPGDIVILDAGDQVPADIRILEAYDLKADEQILTGETRLRSKKIDDTCLAKNILNVDNLLFMGTVIAQGEAMGVVTATGHRTELGKIARRTVEIEKTISPLQEKSAKMAKLIAIIAIILAIALIIYRYFVDSSFLSALTFSVALAAGIIPEGLPATMSVALSFGARYLADRKALVRNLVSVETLGSVTVICTDKTGTLTTGDMEVKEIWQPETEIKKEEHERLINEAVVLCNDANISGKINIGDPMEIALLRWAEGRGVNIQQIRKKYHKVDEIPFNAQRKFMTVTLQDGGRKFNLTKGAPEEVLTMVALSKKEEKEITQKFSVMASAGYRVIALSYNDVFLALVAIFDPPRPEVSEAIDSCQRGQIKTIMVTGDNAMTAASIAKMVGLYPKEIEPQIITGEQIDEMTDLQLRHVLGGEPLFARTLPEHKFRIVDCLANMGEIVAVTGDGVNDAPALKRADIGIAMGKKGTDVSRETADMILLDDNFATIVQAVKEGRTIFDNIRKFLFYHLTADFGELLTVLFGIFLNLPLPMLAVQILFIDLATNLLPAMSMIFELPEENIMTSKPRSKKVALINGETIIHLTILGLIMGGGAIWNFTAVLHSVGYAQATTVAFATLVICQIFNSFLARTPHITIFKYSFWSNKYLLMAVGLTLIMLFVMVYTRIFHDLLSTLPFPPMFWLRTIIVGIVFLIVDEFYKIIKNRYIKTQI